MKINLTITILITYHFVSLIAQDGRLHFTPVEIQNVDAIPVLDYIYQDKRGVMWFGTYGGLYEYDGYNAIHYFHDPSDSNSLHDNKVTYLFADESEKLWIGSQVGLGRLDLKTREYSSFTGDQYGIRNRGIAKICEDSAQTIWISVEGELYRADQEGKKVAFTRLPYENVIDFMVDRHGAFWLSNGNTLLFKNSRETYFTPVVDHQGKTLGYGNIRLIIEEDDQKLLLIYGGGIFRFFPGTKKFQFVLEIPELIEIKTIIAALAGKRLIIANRIEIIVVDLESNGYFTQALDLDDPANRTKNDIQALWVDRQSILWAGNLSGHPYACDLSTQEFKHFRVNLFEHLRGVAGLFELHEYTPNQIMLPGVTKPMLLDLVNGHEIENGDFVKSGYFNTHQITSFLEDSSLLWIGTGRGLLLFDRKSKNFVSNGMAGSILKELSNMSIRAILKSSIGELWIASWENGLFRWDFKSDSLQHYSFDGPSYSNSIRCLFEDRNKNVWVGTRYGLLKFDPTADSFLAFRHDPRDPESMSENTSFCINQDTLGFIWSGSYGGGLNRFDPVKGVFTHFTTDDGLLNNNIFSLVDDKQGNFWLMSYDGLSKFNPYTFEVINFTSNNGLLNEQFEAFLYGRSVYSGDFFFGGREGIDFFHPDSIRLSNYKAPIIFTGFELFNEPVGIKVKSNEASNVFKLDHHISYINKIALNYKHRVFTIDYAALDFSGPENVHYAYQLFGFDSDWQLVDKKRSATYTNLDPGGYEFRVKSTNADGVWNEDYTALALIITPPWWGTYLAYISYLVVLGLIIYFFYRYQRKRWQLQTALQMQEREAHRLKELDTFKTNLYTNITHEFRTPLTVIGGMTELIRQKPREWMQKGLRTIEDQSQKLLEMVGQILELQKVEAGKLTYQPVQTDIIGFINFVIEPFQFQVKSKGLDFILKHEFQELVIDFDADKLSMVLSNVISNAIKFTMTGQISLSTQIISEKAFQIKIMDTGVGISEDKIPHIFDRFYQADQSSTRPGEGTGIGLALVKELMLVMQGRIEVESVPGDGSSFIMRLPINHEAAEKTWVHSKSVARQNLIDRPVESTGNKFGDRQRILIIEDNAEVRKYLQVMLEDQYSVLESRDGEEGISVAKKVVPDLIISDIMMPRKDGYAVCHELHDDLLTTHIPIILLTAKTDTQSKIKGYQKGADSYLPKPFPPNELKAQIQMLLEQRKRLQSRFRNGQSLSEAMGVDSRRDQFITDLFALIQKNISDDTFGIKEICQQMLVSRSQLHNKIKAVTGLSTSYLIRKIRLEEADTLLRITDLTIAEIAYQVGFRDPNFFSRVYKKEFGKSPRERRE